MNASSATDNDVRLHLYDRFVETGTPPTPAEAALTLRISEDDAAAAYRRLEDAHAIVLAPGTPNVWMAAPLSAVPTAFRVTTARGSYYGNCIWDALGIPAMLDTEAHIESSCGDCGEPLALDVRAGALEGDGVAHFAVSAAHWWENIGFT